MVVLHTAFRVATRGPDAGYRGCPCTPQWHRMEAAAATLGDHPALARGRLASFGNAIYEFFRRCLLWIISAGPIPKHVAIIMDGNRRYASRRQMNKTSGHQFGYESLMYTLRDCYELGVKFVSIYAFSIENFRRSEEEVSTLMNMMEEKLEALIEREGLARQYGIRVQVLGDLSLLPDRVRIAAERAMAVTKGNDRAVLNICAPYTSTQEIVKAVEAVRDELFTRPELRGFGLIKSPAAGGKSKFRFLDGICRDGAADERQNSTIASAPDVLGDDAKELRNMSEVKDGRDEDAKELKNLNEVEDGRDELKNLSEVEHGRDDDAKELKNLSEVKDVRDDEAKELKSTNEVKDVESEEEIERRLQESITADEIERHLYTSNCPEPELLIRTSGETRLSNFLLWQSSLSYLYVTRILWPEFSFRHLVMAIIQYQKVYPILQRKQRELKKISAHSD